MQGKTYNNNTSDQKLSMTELKEQLDEAEILLKKLTKKYAKIQKRLEKSLEEIKEINNKFCLWKKKRPHYYVTSDSWQTLDFISRVLSFFI